MAEQIKLRIVLSEDDIRKLVVAPPDTLQELNETITNKFEISNDFRLQYLDPDFDDYINLASIVDVRDKGTLRVVAISVPETDSESSWIQAADTSTESISSDTVIITPNDEPLSSSSFSDYQCRTKGWPANFPVPKFSYDIELKLKQANDKYGEDGSLINPKTVNKSAILERMAEQIFQFKAYPTDLELGAASQALVTTHPCLRELVLSGYYGWKMSLKFKMGNFRTRLRNSGCAELNVNSLRAKREGEKKPAQNIKKARKAEVNYLPTGPEHETEQSLEKHRLDLVEEMRKRYPNETLISDKMGKTFAKRRQEIIVDKPMVNEVQERWPALFTQSQLNAEFRRMTTSQLTPCFMENLDKCTDALMKTFNAKGGAQGRRIKNILQVAENAKSNVDVRRAAVLKALCHYFGEESIQLVKEFEDGDSFDHVQATFENQAIGIYVIRKEGETAVEPPADIGVCLEGSSVLSDIPTVAEACAVAMGLIYALDIVYPKNLKYFYEACQKIFLQLGEGNVNPKVHTLKKKLATA